MQLLDVRQLSSLLKVKEKTLYHWGRQGKIPCIKLGRLVRFDYDKIVELLETDSLNTKKINHDQ